MSIIYIISILILFTLTILIKKSNEKLEITKTLIIIGTIMLAYNTFVCYILNLINIPITLLSLTIVNLLISIALIIKLIKNKQIQKYKASKTNIVVAILFIIITTLILHINFDDLTKIRYVSMDAREHYKSAREFSENTSLSNKARENNTVGEAFMPMGYVNAGILFKITNPYIGTVQLYKIYILFEAFVYLLTGLMFYILVEKHCKNVNAKIIALIFSIIYVLGYPLNAWISGFHYLVIGILSIETIIFIMSEKDKLYLGYHIIVMLLLNFGLILSYALFCPFVYLAEFVYYVYEYIKAKDKLKLFILVISTLILPGMIGVSYLIIPSFGKVGEFIALEGWIYKSLWSNLILFIPFAIYSIYKSIKNKEFTHENILFILLILYMLILFIGMKMQKCSEYYFFKNYFILWLMLIYLNTKGMIQFIETKIGMYIVNIYIIIYLVIFGVSIYSINTYVMQEASDSLNNTMQIFTFNKTMMFAKNAEFITNEELELYSSIEKIIEGKWNEYNNEILFITDPTQERWIQSLTRYKNILFDDVQYAINNLNENTYKYIVISKNRDTYRNINQYLNRERLQLIYETKDGEIYIKQGE